MYRGSGGGGGDRGNENFDFILGKVFLKKVIKSYDEDSYTMDEMIDFEMNDLAITEGDQEKIQPILKGFIKKYEGLWDSNKDTIEQSFRNLIEKIENKKIERKILRQKHSSNQKIKNVQKELDELFDIKANSLNQVGQNFRLKLGHNIKNLKTILRDKQYQELVEKRFLSKIDKVKELAMKQASSEFKRRNIYETLDDPKNFEYVVADFYNQFFVNSGFELMMTHDYDDKCNATDFYMNFSDDENQYFIGVDTTLEIDYHRLNAKAIKAENNTEVDFVYDENGDKIKNIMKVLLAPNFDMDSDLDMLSLIKYLLLHAYSRNSDIKTIAGKMSFDEKNEIKRKGEDFCTYLAQKICDKVLSELNKELLSLQRKKLLDLKAVDIQSGSKNYSFYSNSLDVVDKKILEIKNPRGLEKLIALKGMLKTLLESEDIKKYL